MFHDSVNALFPACFFKPWPGNSVSLI
jgi:hypothetical protein